VKLEGSQNRPEVREATMAEFTQQQRKQMTPQSQQLENKNLTEI